MQSATAVPVAVAVPDRVQQASQVALLTIWGEAQEIAHENLKAAQVAWDAERNEAETLRGQMSSAFEIQAAELEAAQLRIVELEANAKTAAAELADVRDSAREEASRAREEAAKLRGQLDATQEQQAALMHALAQRNAKAEPTAPAPTNKTIKANKAGTL